MAKCKTCGKKFHACSNCCLNFQWEYDYCCENHWNDSKEYVEILLKFNKFYGFLSAEQAKMFKKILDLGDDYYNEMIDWMKNIDNIKDIHRGE